ncbi:uncharacterized protein LOC100701447 [Oreochromis niloticus]|uniref:Uncharacterized LOC100701447 n=1 Tax=Oreochromis niloticus TaxID=8128 RepID=I3IX91_ORENI|nr:uncharacterized protein LOC100701447 [Oreochromis niloticus]
MIGGLSALILLSTTSLLHTAEVPHLISLTTLELGGNATFHCPFSEKTDRFFHWYKQSLGKMVQTVATVVYNKIEFISPFNHTRFHVHKSNDQCFLTINHINKEDEATYFCQTGTEFLQHFVRGFFLAVNDYNHQTSVYVTQTPKSSSVQLGNTVTLQCSLFAKNKESSVQCPSDHSVHWFKSGSGENHPSIIYRNFTHRNSMDDTERRCIYHLSKTIQNSSDTGTYYCAVVTCGAILFGEGSKVDTRTELDPVILILGGLLVCCVTVIIVLISCMTCCHFKGATSVSHRLGHNKSVANPTNDLDGEAKDVNYAPLDFSTRKMRQGKKKKSDYTDCVYSFVKSEGQNQQ